MYKLYVAVVCEMCKGEAHVAQNMKNRPGAGDCVAVSGICPHCHCTVEVYIKLLPHGTLENLTREQFEIEAARR